MYKKKVTSRTPAVTIQLRSREFTKLSESGASQGQQSDEEWQK
jgi:hypothetical protein